MQTLTAITRRTWRGRSSVHCWRLVRAGGRMARYVPARDSAAGSSQSPPLRRPPTR